MASGLSPHTRRSDRMTTTGRGTAPRPPAPADDAGFATLWSALRRQNLPVVSDPIKMQWEGSDMHKYSDENFLASWLKRALRARFGAVVKEPVPDTLLSLLSEAQKVRNPNIRQTVRYFGTSKSKSIPAPISDRQFLTHKTGLMVVTAKQVLVELGFVDKGYPLEC
jgi:hypothetical protein